MDRRTLLSRAALGTAPFFFPGRPRAVGDRPARSRGGSPPGRVATPRDFALRFAPAGEPVPALRT